ncbi:MULTISPECIES: sensor domain-containing protein [Cytobacillus]|uniref:PAS domain S-box protein n=2 Tax=Cytobacillus TaxID=2675230 RepID=A0A160MAG1_9BACI|nr:GGDEF domain-containing protein [Cytobacillus oceanisediminis]MCS0822573.1 diguanylate cyclase [Cytobacillus firmus]AND39756.1 PAS domain S-box protein [Cytobacillus oceanisediminis 2691]MBU8729017.1 diguanylate cyclase [Cytobacillus oceanisediminis]MCM3244842.1 diguanylate cyclase [Cytobacillus oceanisediminis]MCM3394369.1 diguanylate cyclase [Cytobacillus oceanisediminis]
MFKNIDLFNQAFFFAPIGMSIVSLEGKWIRVNHALTKITGYTEDELLTTNFQTLTYPKDLDTDLSYTQELVEGKRDSFEMEKRYVHKSGKIVWVLLSVSIVREGNKPLFLISQIQDITDRKNSERILKQMAHYDFLTQLPNRRLFEERLNHAIESANFNKGLVAVLYLDLDGFKQINDTFGHDLGDLLLKEVASRLTGCIGNKDTVARLAGDEFTILLPETTIDNAKHVAERIIDILSNKVSVQNVVISITPSIGIAFCDDFNMDVRNLLKYADEAMYQAKQNGKNNYQVSQIR